MWSHKSWIQVAIIIIIIIAVKVSVGGSSP